MNGYCKISLSIYYIAKRNETPTKKPNSPSLALPKGERTRTHRLVTSTNVFCYSGRIFFKWSTNPVLQEDSSSWENIIKLKKNLSVFVRLSHVKALCVGSLHHVSTSSAW